MQLFMPSLGMMTTLVVTWMFLKLEMDGHDEGKREVCFNLLDDVDRG